MILNQDNQGIKENENKEDENEDGIYKENKSKEDENSNQNTEKEDKKENEENENKKEGENNNENNENNPEYDDDIIMDDDYHNDDIRQNHYIFGEDYPNCSDKNTTRDSFGVCVCKEGYLGDPMDENGCYKCDEKCDENAICVYPGVCQCAYGFSGNASVKCYPEIPKILSVSPNKIPLKGGVFINVSFSTNAKIKISGYCKIGKVLVPSKNVDLHNNLMFCLAPPQDSGKYPIFISFDSHFWSNETFTIEYSQENAFLSIAIIIFVYCLIVLFAGIGIYLLTRKKPPQPSKDELEPFSIQDGSKKVKRKPAIRIKK